MHAFADHHPMYMCIPWILSQKILFQKKDWMEDHSVDFDVKDQPIEVDDHKGSYFLLAIRIDNQVSI